ncbi:MAG: pyridoxal phosphate-dependent aminotransferase [Spirochaetia bacterium]|nr:pyridoxal phosphate-dependent aminotransferase [Spirochaetia bacterium]
MQVQFSQKMSRIDSSEIRKMFDLAAHLKNPKNLSIGQPDFPVPEVVKESLIRAVREDKNSYTLTQGILPLREKLSQIWSENGIDIQPENILISGGVAPVLYLLFDTLFEEGDDILIIEPYFLIYESLAGFHNLKRTYLSENFSSEDLEVLKANPLFKPKAVIFSSPSNPTGKILTKEQISLLAGFSRVKDCLVISDEIYSAFDYEKKHVRAASIAPEKTITLGGFSKSHAMTGLRVGYMGVHKSLAPLMQKMSALQQYSVVCSPAPCQWAAVTALEHPISTELNIMEKRRKMVLDALTGKVAFPFPDGAFYVFPSVPVDSKEFVARAIEQELLIVPGYIFSRDSKTVRISYAQKEDILEEGLQIFLKVISLLS